MSPMRCRGSPPLVCGLTNACAGQTQRKYTVPNRETHSLKLSLARSLPRARSLSLSLSLARARARSLLSLEAATTSIKSSRRARERDTRDRIYP